LKKYFKIFSISLKNSFAYIKDFIIGNIFIGFIIVIYVLLWRKVYAGNVRTGFTFAEMIWYLIINEAVFTSNGDMFRQIEKDIKSGSIAYYLNKPYSYPLYMLFDALGRNVTNFIVCIVSGAIIGLYFVGPIPALKLINIVPILVMMLLGVILNILIFILISLTSFWFEENKPFIWIYRQFVFAFGGFLVPITLFPEVLYNITLHMPWTYVAFHTANSCVKFSISNFMTTILWQLGYIGLFLALVMLAFKKGAEALNVNGG
jgi:ABC-2 type transport system permease protein